MRRLPLTPSFALRALRVGWLALALLLVASRARADLTAVFGADQDAVIYSNNGGLNGGGAPRMRVGRIAGAPGSCETSGAGNICGALRRTLVHFNVTSVIPAGSLITGATLQLTLPDNCGGAC